MRMRVVVIVALLLAPLAWGEENCGSMLRTMTRFRGTVRSVTFAQEGAAFDAVDLDPKFAVTIDAGERTYVLGIHSVARTFREDKVAGRTFDFDAGEMQCDGKFRRLLTLRLHQDTPVVETYDRTVEVGHRYRAAVKDGLELAQPLALPRHHEGGITFTNAAQFPGELHEIVFDVEAWHITHEGGPAWRSILDAKIVSAK